MISKFGFTERFKNILDTPIQNWVQYAIILGIALAFIFMPQHIPVDWNLNTDGYWSSFPYSYADPAKVFPPWGIILMLPYYWIRAEGTRFLSVLVIGLLAVKRRWNLLQFFAIVFSPYFLVTMAKSNLDIFVFVLPILIWDLSTSTRWQSLGWGTAMSLSLIKPQGMFFIWIYWLWNYRKLWKEMLLPFGIVVLVTVPISLVGSPPLFYQWISNLLNPNTQNEFWWSVNNLSLTSSLGLLPGLMALLLAILIVISGIWIGWIQWSRDHLFASLLFLSFFLLPYASQQSVSSAFAFVPSGPSLAIQWIGVLVGLRFLDYNNHVPLFILFFCVASMFLFRAREE